MRLAGPQPSLPGSRRTRLSRSICSCLRMIMLLHAVLERFRARLATGRRDARLQRLRGLFLGLDQQLDELVRGRREPHRGDLGRRPGTERDDLLDEPPHVGEVELGEPPQGLADVLVGEADDASRGHRVRDRRAVLQAQRLLQALHRLVDVEQLLLGGVTRRRRSPTAGVGTLWAWRCAYPPCCAVTQRRFTAAPARTRAARVHALAEAGQRYSTKSSRSFSGPGMRIEKASSPVCS